MANLKQRLVEDTKRAIAANREEVKQSDDELAILEARLKVEKRFYAMKDIDKGLKEDVKYSVQALEAMLAMERNRNAELKKDARILEYRSRVIEKIDNDDF